MNIVKFAFNQKSLVYFILVIFIFGGINSFLDMPKLEDPEIKVKQAVVVTSYIGASSYEVELEVTDVIEKSIRTIDGIDEVKSRSQANFSEIHVKLKSTVRSDKVEQIWDILRRKVQRAREELPSDAGEPMVLDDFGDVYGIFYAMTSDGYNYEEMKNYADFVKLELQKINGVRRIEIYGERKQNINIEISSDKMANLGVHPLEIMMTIQGQNKKVYSGNYENEDERIRISINNTYKSLDDFKNLIIQGHEKDQIKLGSIAHITKTYEENYRSSMRTDQKPALGITLSVESGVNVVEIGKKITRHLEYIKNKLPVGIEFKKIFYQPEKVDTAINEFIINLLLSVLIVILVLVFAMGFKSSILIASSLVITIIATLLFLDMMGGTLQRVSLASFILAMGMLVDNAIVIVDGILIDLQKGVERKKAMLLTAQKMSMPLLGATFIAIISFFPIVLSPDTSGEYAKDLFFVLGFSLLISWFLSLSQVPLFASKMLKAKKNTNNNNDIYNGKIYVFFRKILNFSLNHKIISLSIFLILLFSSLYFSKNIKQSLFPDLTYNQCYIEYRLPQGSKISSVKEDLLKIESYLMKIPKIKNVTMSLGQTPARYNLVRKMAEVNSYYGELIIDFEEYKNLETYIPELENYLNENYPQAETRIRKYNLMSAEYSVTLMFKGANPEILKKLAKKAKKIFSDSKMTKIINDNWHPKSKYIVANYSQRMARMSQITRENVSMALLAATDGLPIGTYYEGNNALNILMKTRNSDGKKNQKLENISVWGIPSLNFQLENILKGSENIKDIKDKVSTTTPLSQITNDLQIEWEESVIRRYNGQRAIDVQCEPLAKYNADELRKAVLEQVNQIDLPEGYTMEWKGEYADSKRALKYIIKSLPLTIMLIILVLIALFRDFKKPLVILLSLPFAAIGVIYGMLFTGMSFGFMAIVGAIGLMGMMIKNGVVLLDEIGEQLKNGIEAYTAVIESSISRVRPVMMASVTTVLGMIPLLGDAMFKVMAVTIISGLAVGTLITLVVIPVLYALFFKIKQVKS